MGTIIAAMYVIYITYTFNSNLRPTRTLIMCIRHSTFSGSLPLELAATLRWFTAGGAIRIAVRQLSQTWKLRHYDVTDDVITRRL